MFSKPSALTFLNSFSKKLPRTFPYFLLVLGVIAYFSVSDGFWDNAMDWHWDSGQEPHLLLLANWLSHWWDFWPGGIFLCFSFIVAGCISLKNHWIKIGLIALAAALLAGGFNMVLKSNSGRARPFIAKINNLNDKFYGPHAGSKFASFASGHTTTAFAFAFVIFLFKRRLGILFLHGATAVAWSRLYVGAHYLGDVIAGIWIGFYFAWLLFESQKAIPFQPKENHRFHHRVTKTQRF